MPVVKKYISIVLLLAFSFLAVPPALTHLLFADHNDTACEQQKGNTKVIEEPHEHCEVFSVKTSVYDRPQLFLFTGSANVFLATVQSALPSFHGQNSSLRLPARAPPII